MTNRRGSGSIFPRPIVQLARCAAAMFVLWIVCLILTPYPFYLPPDFRRGFLINKAGFFFSTGYFVGFYAHIAASPLAILCGTLQLSRTIRARYPRIHRFLGRCYVLLVSAAVVPGGLVMSLRASGGWPSTLGFVLICVSCGGFTIRGWRLAKAGDYRGHGRWMCRSYCLLASAIALRLIHYLLQPIGFDPVVAYRTAVWLSGIVPLAVGEAWLWATRTQRTHVPPASDPSATARSA